MQLGIAYNRAVLFDKAITAFDKALALEPQNKEALFGKDIAMRGSLGQSKFYAYMGWKNPEHID